MTVLAIAGGSLPRDEPARRARGRRNAYDREDEVDARNVEQIAEAVE
jgi:hypothetical protein